MSSQTSPQLRAELIPAMVTPFRRDHSVDFERAEALAVYLAENGCDGILINGTTGESPTMSFDEKRELVKVVQAALRGKASHGKPIQIVAGAGSNCTEKSITEAKAMAALGVDALLVVVPYYNKPTQRGMHAHFKAVAQAVDTEVVIYNIPSRSVVQMTADTMAKLHQDCPNIIGVKQSCPDLDAMSEITAKLPAESWRTWCGDDSLTLPMMACGAYGLFSVLAHLTAPLTRQMIQAVKQHDMTTALSLHLKLLEPAKEIFFLPNPTVMKTCLARLGMMEPTLRAPMLEPDEAEMTRIEALLKHCKPLMPQLMPSATAG